MCGETQILVYKDTGIKPKLSTAQHTHTTKNSFLLRLIDIMDTVLKGCPTILYVIQPHFAAEKCFDALVMHWKPWLLTHRHHWLYFFTFVCKY